MADIPLYQNNMFSFCIKVSRYVNIKITIPVCLVDGLSREDHFGLVVQNNALSASL